METENLDIFSENSHADPGAIGRRRGQAVAAMLVTRTIGEAAAKIGIDESTMYRWMREPETKELLRQAETDLIDTVVTRLAAEAGKSLDALTEIRDDRSAPAGARVRASTVLLEFTVRLREQLTFERRLAALEDRQ